MVVLHTSAIFAHMCATLTTYKTPHLAPIDEWFHPQIQHSPKSYNQCFGPCDFEPKLHGMGAISNVAHEYFRASKYTHGCVRFHGAHTATPKAKRTLFVNEVADGWVADDMVELSPCKLQTNKKGYHHCILVFINCAHFKMFVQVAIALQPQRQ